MDTRELSKTLGLYPQLSHPSPIQREAELTGDALIDIEKIQNAQPFSLVEFTS